MSAKPLHPTGRVFRASVSRVGSATHTGVPWIDRPGEDPAVVRVSRALGLPGPLPDIPGLAVRVDLETGGHADVLFAGTGTGRLGRFLLRPRFRAADGPLTTLLPYRSEHGPLGLAAVPDGERSWELRWSLRTGPWRTFALLQLGAEMPEEEVSFDPVLHRLPGLEQYGWVTRVREPGYRTARRLTGRRSV